MPKLDFWKRLFGRRSQILGKMPDSDISSKLGLNEKDAKVDNRNPRKAFAVNLDVDLEQFFRLETDEQIANYVRGTDDFDRPVTHIPISKTSSKIFFDFAPCGMTIPYDGQDVPLPRFISDVCYGLRDGLLPQREQLAYFLIDKAENLILTRLSWLPEMESWYPLFSDKERGDS
jgi:hypothetical protein